MKLKHDAIVKEDQGRYLDELLPASTGVLLEMEEYAAANQVPIADREVAKFLEITARSIGANRCLEIGMAIGYGAAHLAMGMPDDGNVVTIEPSDNMINLAVGYLTKLGLRNKVIIEKGKALDILPSLSGPFDLLYLDAVKEEYSEYLDLSLPLLRTGAVIIADNLLWGGQVAGEINDLSQETSTIALRKFNQKFVNHPQLKAQVLSVGDGLGYGVKIS